MKERKKWITVNGMEVPANRITESEKAKEKHSEKILRMAQDINKRLAELKKYVHTATQEIVELVAEENKIEKIQGKGNYTWYNFSRQIRIEIQLNERIVFDDMKINEAKALLDEFLEQKITTSAAFVKSIILDAFSTSKGKLDTRKVMSLFKYKSKISDEMFQRALELIGDAIDRPSSKIYSRISVRNDKGEYEYVDLNYSNL